MQISFRLETYSQSRRCTGECIVANAANKGLAHSRGRGFEINIRRVWTRHFSRYASRSASFSWCLGFRGDLVSLIGTQSEDRGSGRAGLVWVSCWGTSPLSCRSYPSSASAIRDNHDGGGHGSGTACSQLSSVGS